MIGTNDGGRSVKNECKELASKLKKAARMLNIKPHDVSGKLMYSACDLEGKKKKRKLINILNFKLKNFKLKKDIKHLTTDIIC